LIPLTFFKDFGSAQTLQERKASDIDKYSNNCKTAGGSSRVCQCYYIEQNRLGDSKELEILKASIQN
jgi:hypothetical protein